MFFFVFTTFIFLCSDFCFRFIRFINKWAWLDPPAPSGGSPGPTWSLQRVLDLIRVDHQNLKLYQREESWSEACASSGDSSWWWGGARLISVVWIRTFQQEDTSDWRHVSDQQLDTICFTLFWLLWFLFCKDMLSTLWTLFWKVLHT